MDTHQAWCPNCGERLNHRFPLCTVDGSPTPLYVEVNVLAQYFIGVTTFVEFRLINASETPLELEKFDVSLGGRTLEPGVYPETSGQTLHPGEDQCLVLDRKVELGISDAVQGEYELRVSAAFIFEDKRFTMAGRHPIRIAAPGNRQVHAFDPGRQEFLAREDGEFPFGEPCELDSYGEQQVCMYQVVHIHDLKRRCGLRFVPLVMRYETAAQGAPNGDPKRQGRVSCAACGATLIEGGVYCHACGSDLPRRAPIPKPPRSETVAFCPHCVPPRGLLRDRHRFCPLCGERIHLHLEIKAVPSFMEGVQVAMPVRFHKVCEEPVELRRFEVTLGRGEGAVPCDIDPFPGAGVRIADALPVEFHSLVYCPPGHKVGTRVIDFLVEYEAGGHACLLTGSSRIRVLRGDADKQTIINRFGPDTVEAAESVVGLGAWSVNLQGFSQDKINEFINKLTELSELSYEPVRFRMDQKAPLAVEPPAPPLPAAPDWPPAHRARIWFEHEGLKHNYCLLTTFSQQEGRYGAVRFGRSAKKVHVRLVEIERYLHRQSTEQQQSGSSGKPVSRSSISQMQWEVTPVPEPAAYGALHFEHLSASNRGRVTENKKLTRGHTCRLGRGEQIAIELFASDEPVLGLHYAANATRFEGLDEARATAREVLNTMKKTPPHLPEWPGNHGGYRLDRLFSLTGKPIEGLEAYDSKTREVYILIPGWATLGSADSACVVVPGEGVAPIHAYLLHVDGYFFILPKDDTPPVFVGDENVQPGRPHPIRAEDTLVRLGDTAIHVDAFHQEGLKDQACLE